MFSITAFYPNQFSSRCNKTDLRMKIAFLLVFARDVFCKERGSCTNPLYKQYLQKFTQSCRERRSDSSILEVCEKSQINKEVYFERIKKEHSRMYRNLSVLIHPDKLSTKQKKNSNCLKYTTKLFIQLRKRYDENQSAMFYLKNNIHRVCHHLQKPKIEKSHRKQKEQHANDIKFENKKRYIWRFRDCKRIFTRSLNSTYVRHFAFTYIWIVVLWNVVLWYKRCDASSRAEYILLKCMHCSHMFLCANLIDKKHHTLFCYICSIYESYLMVRLKMRNHNKRKENYYNCTAFLCISFPIVWTFCLCVCYFISYIYLFVNFK